MTSGKVKLILVLISLRSIWPKWHFKPHWVFQVNNKCHSEIKLHRIINLISQCACVLLILLKNTQYRNIRFASIKLALIKSYHLHTSNRILLRLGKLSQWNRHEAEWLFKAVWDLKQVWVHFGVKISLRCKVAFTWVQAKWNSLRCTFHFSQFARSSQWVFHVNCFFISPSYQLQPNLVSELL